MNSSNPADSDPTINPFAPPASSDTPNPFTPALPADGVKFSGLGVRYWGSLALFAGICLASTLAFGFILAIFGISTSFFAMVYGIMYHARLGQKFLAGEVRQPVSELAVLLGSLVLGAVGTIAAAILFVATCVPTSIMVDAFQPAGRSQNGIWIIAIASAVIAVACVCLLFRLVLPRKPRNM